MKAALAIARRGLGRVAPNPAVGCILVKDEVVVGRGWTQPGGRPHAETEALARAGARAQGSTVYVTLEPCAHVGETPSCARELVSAGVARVVIATGDPDKRTAGQGAQILRDAGVEVTEGVCGDAARELNQGFLLAKADGRPMVTLKLATSLDGRIATHSGDSMWITGEGARAAGHLLRAEHDAILVGSGTALLDDPALTCRLPGLEQYSPIRIVADGRLRLSLTSKLVTTANETPTWVLTSSNGDKARHRAFEDVGVTVIDVPETADHGIDMGAAMKALAQRGITRVLVEGGSHLAASLLRAHMVDRVHWFRAPSILGGDGLPALQALGVDTVTEGVALDLITSERIGADVAEVYKTRFGTHG